MDGRVTKKFLSALLLVLFIITVVLPVAYVVVDSFTDLGSVTLKHYEKICTSHTFLLLLKSCAVAFTTAAAAALAGGLFGYMLSRTDIPFSGPLKLLLLLPLFVSPYYLAVAWRDFIFFMYGNTSMLKSEKAVAAILFMCYMPVSTLIMSASFANINSRIEEAGLLFTGRIRTVWFIIFPLAKPALISSFALVFILAVSEITVPSYYMVNLLPTELFMQFTAFYDHKAAAAMGAVICILCIVLLLIERSFLSNAAFLAIGKKGNVSNTTRLGKWKYPLLALAVSYLVVVVIVPLVVLGLQTFREGIPDYLRDNRLPGGYMPMDREPGYTMDFFLDGFKLLKPVLQDSIVYAFAGSLLACGIGFAFAYQSERRNIKWMDYMLLFIFAMPSTLYGIALIKFYNRPSFEFIYSSVLIILIGYIGKFTFVASRIIGNSIRQIPYSLEEAASLSGAGFRARMRHILFPLLFKGIFTAFLVCFIFCLGEMAVTIVIYPPGKSFLPVAIATSMHSTPESLISAMVFIVLMLTFSMLAVLYFIQNYITKKYNHVHHTT